MKPAETAVADHYARNDLSETILSALKAAGKDPDNLVLEDLAPLDEFHVRGREATAELAELVAPARGAKVLDLGSGIGGPSRVLAARFGCDVVGIDLTAAYCRAATVLAGRVGLDHLVHYRQGNALATPFDDGAFDLVWTQHAAMNIADKAGLYREAHRVLRSGGRFALYDVLAGPGGPPHYPVPWARDPAISFLVSPDELRDLLNGAGFQIETWQDRTEAARAWFRKFAARLQGGEKARLGIRTILGEDFPVMAENLARSFAEDRLAVAQVVCRRP